MSAVLADVEVTIPQGEQIVSPEVEANIAAAVRLIQAGAKPETVMRTVYLFGYMDGVARS